MDRGRREEIRADMLEDSSRAHHRAVAAMQGEQMRRLLDVERRTRAWGREEALSGKCNPGQIEWICDEHVRRTRAQIHAAMMGLSAKLLKEKAGRDAAINSYVDGLE